MITYHNKTDVLTKKILVHVAQNGFSDLNSFSRLAKATGTGRSLLYFYYKKEEDIIDGLFELFTREIDYHSRQIIDQNLNFDQYLEYLYVMREPYFFSIECVKAVSNRTELWRFINYIYQHIDMYAMKQFIKKYDLSFLEQSQTDYMYSSLRSRWFERSGPYDSWTIEKIIYLRTEMDQFILSLKEEMKTKST